MINDLLNKFASLGVSDENSKQLNRKIKLTNKIAMLVALVVALPFMVISMIYFDSIAFLPGLGILVCFIIVGCNIAGLTLISRLLMAILPICLEVCYTAYLLPAGSSLPFEMYCLALGFVVIPFLVFDLSETRWLLFCLLFIVATLLFVIEPLNAKLEAELDTSIITDGYLGKVNIFLSILFLFASITTLAFENLQYRIQSEKLVEEMELKAKELSNSEQELKDNLKKIEQQQEEEKRRNWATEGIAKFSNLMRGNLKGEDIYKQIVYDLSKYIDANQCWMFLTNKEGNNVTLDLVSCYAYDRHKFLEKSIIPGQGLAGQAYLEKRHIYLLDIPDNYVNITSGLGEAPPKAILIMPLVVNEEVQGIFEIASFRAYEPFEIEFVRELSEALASFISVNRINDRTKVLLEESQQQAEEMRSQEEEMRQNMEELAATQEEMQRKEQEYVARIEELENELGKNIDA